MRHRRVETVTTLFWRQAIQESRARVWVQRFRHLAAFLLILAIAWLSWLSLADLRFQNDRAATHLIMVDGSAGMAWGARFADAHAQLKRTVADTPGEQRWVVWCGARSF